MVSPHRAEDPTEAFRLRDFTAMLPSQTPGKLWPMPRMQEASPWRTIRQDHSHNDSPLTKELCSVLCQRLMSGPCTAKEAASLFTMSRRILTQYLENEGLTFRTLTNQTRFEITCRMLTEKTMTLTKIAGALHYAEPGILSRFSNFRADCHPLSGTPISEANTTARDTFSAQKLEDARASCG